LVDDGEEVPFKEGEWMFIPTGFFATQNTGKNRFG
jgi:hypothetical protein